MVHCLGAGLLIGLGAPTEKVIYNPCGFDVVHEGRTGFLVEEGDVQVMASAMSRLVESPNLAAELG